jgi:hypothetical protein
MLIVDTNTPATEISVIDAEGRVVERGIRKHEAELPVGLYKILYRIGDRVTDSLIELPPGEGAFDAPIPPLPIVSAAPHLLGPVQATEYARELLLGPRWHHGAGASLLVFVTTVRRSNSPPPPESPGAGLSVRQFSGGLVADLAEAPTKNGCSGCNLDLDPGRYLLRAVSDSGAPTEQTLVVAPGWQTRVYIRLTENRISPPSSTGPWQFDLPQTGVIMARDSASATPVPDDDARKTAAARQALAAGRGDAAPNREMIGALLRGKLENPMLGIYAGHLLTLQPKPDRELLREVYTNLYNLVGPHPDVQALLIALGDRRAQELTYPEPPMLYASWSLVLRVSTREHDLRPERSYSARISASLWGSGAWLSWRMPPPETEALKRSPDLLQALIEQAAAGRLDAPLTALLEEQRELSPTELVLARYLAAASKRLSFAKELTADEDSSSAIGRIVFPIWRRFIDSELEKQTKQRIACELTAENLSKLSGIPYVTMLDAAATLGQKLGLEQSGRSRLFQRAD